MRKLVLVAMFSLLALGHARTCSGLTYVADFDVDGDSDVDSHDLHLLELHARGHLNPWDPGGEYPPPASRYDVNNDNVSNLEDVVDFLAYYEIIPGDTNLDYVINHVDESAIEAGLSTGLDCWVNGNFTIAIDGSTNYWEVPFGVDHDEDAVDPWDVAVFFIMALTDVPDSPYYSAGTIDTDDLPILINWNTTLLYWSYYLPTTWQDHPGATATDHVNGCILTMLKQDVSESIPELYLPAYSADVTQDFNFGWVEAWEDRGGTGTPRTGAPYAEADGAFKFTSNGFGSLGHDQLMFVFTACRRLALTLSPYEIFEYEDNSDDPPFTVLNSYYTDGDRNLDLEFDTADFAVINSYSGWD